MQTWSLVMAAMDMCISIFIIILFALTEGIIPMHTVRLLYKPYGPKMCRELCQDLPHTFIYIVEDLSCHRIPKNGSINTEGPLNEDSYSCIETQADNRTSRTVMTRRNTVITSRNICNMGYNDEQVFQALTDAKKAAPTEVQELIHENRNWTLHQACEKGLLCVVKYIISRGLEDINRYGKGKKTPVMVAAKNGHAAVFDYLVSQDCDLTAIDVKERNVLHYACFGGNTDIVRTLIEDKDYDIECADWGGWTPVMCAASSGHRRVLDLLMNKGCNMKSESKRHNNILHIDCIAGRVDMVKYILSLNIADKDSRGFYGRTAIMHAVARDHREVFDLLKSEGCNLTTRDNDENNILHIACLYDHVSMVEYILSQNLIDIESRGHFGRTSVIQAVGMGHRRVYDALQSKGCNLKVLDDESNNILHTACVGGHVDMVEYILTQNILSIESRGYNGRTPAIQAASMGKKDVIELLLKKGCNPKARDKNNNTMLHMACIKGHIDIVRYVLDQNIIDIESQGFLGRTPVMIAAETGQREVIYFLMKRGCSMKALDYLKNTILHVACMVGKVDVIKYLITLKTVRSMNKMKNVYGRTPVKEAEKHGYKTIAGLLKNIHMY